MTTRRSCALWVATCVLLASVIGCGGSGGSKFTTPPPVTNTLAYLHRVNGLVDYDIDVLRSDGSVNTIATNGEYISVVLSPNGQKVLISYYDGVSGYQIATMNPDGTGLTGLAAGLYPQYTPDGSKIVYEAGRQVGVMNSDGSNQTVITNLSAGQYCWPATNGTIIAVNEVPVGISGLATMNMDGSNQQIIVSTQYPVFSTFSANGSQIIFSNSDGQQTNIYSVATNGTSLVSLTNSTLNWDPFVVGNTIYFDSVASNVQNPTIDSYQIYSLTMGGSTPTAVTNDTVYDGFKTGNGSCDSP